jgi:short-subunit dehydrogenase
MEISDKVFIVTGASSGIGLATAVALTGRGAKVALVARSSDALQTLAGTLSGSLAIPLRNLRSLRRLRAKLCSTTSCSSASNRALLGFSMTARMELQKDGIVVSEVYLHHCY